MDRERSIGSVQTGGYWKWSVARHMCTSSIQAGWQSRQCAKYSAAHAFIAAFSPKVGVKCTIHEATEDSLSFQSVRMSYRCSRETGQKSGEAPELWRFQVQPGLRSSFKVVFTFTFFCITYDKVLCLVKPKHRMETIWHTYKLFYSRCKLWVQSKCVLLSEKI